MKRIERGEVGRLGERLRSAGLRVVSTNGCFDLLHVGHLRYLQAARALGDVLVVGVNSDESVRGLKGDTRPVVPEAERAELLAGLECVDHVFLFDELRPDAFLAELRPHVHAKGGDYAPEDLLEAETVRRHGGEVRVLPLTPGHSTTELLRRARAGEGS